VTSVPDNVPDNVPDDGGGDWLRLDPLSVIARALILLRGSAFFLVVLIFGGQQMFGQAIPTVSILLLILAANMGLAVYEWRVTRYRIGTSDVRMEKGLVSRAARSVPYERIQDVSLEQALIPRLLGLAEVRFETGAGGKDELKLAYVQMAEGERLRRAVRSRAEGAEGTESREAGETTQEAADDEAGEVLFAMDLPRLVTFGMFEFSLVVFAVLLGAAQQLDFLLPFDIWDVEGWGGRLAGPDEYLSGLDMLGRTVGVVTALGGIAVVGFATGIFRTVQRDYGFVLEDAPRGFRRRRGLFTRTDVVMPRHRVQAVTVSTRVLRKLFGWHGLSFISLAQDSRSANHDVAPFAQMEEIAPIARAAGFPLPQAVPDWRRPSGAYFFVRALVGIMVCIVGGVVATAIVGSIWPGLGFVALAAALAVRAYYLWRVERHALGAAQVLSRRGWLAPRLTIASRIKLHSAQVAQGPLGHWLGYADLNLGLAGGVLSFRGLPREDAEAMRDAVLESIAAVDFARLEGANQAPAI